jgi:hypothetical protein
MSLLIVYVVLMITGDFVAYLIGLVIEKKRAGGKPAGLPGDVFSVPLGRLGHRGPNHAAEGAASISSLSA